MDCTFQGFGHAPGQGNLVQTTLGRFLLLLIMGSVNLIRFLISQSFCGLVLQKLVWYHSS